MEDKFNPVEWFKKDPIQVIIAVVAILTLGVIFFTKNKNNPAVVAQPSGTGTSSVAPTPTIIVIPASATEGTDVSYMQPVSSSTVTTSTGTTTTSTATTNSGNGIPLWSTTYAGFNGTTRTDWTGVSIPGSKTINIGPIVPGFYNTTPSNFYATTYNGTSGYVLSSDIGL